MTGLIRRPGFWLILVLVALITVPQYIESLSHPSFLANLIDDIGLERHAFERILYIAPIVWAGFLFGMKGAAATSFIALLCMLPRAIVLSPSRADALFETGAVFVVGFVLAFSFEALHKERVRRTQLAALNKISSAASQSLRLDQVLFASADNLLELMNVDASLLFLIDEKEYRVTLAASKGISQRFALALDGFKPGEGPVDQVIRSGVPLYIRNAGNDPWLCRQMPDGEHICSILSAPLKSKGVVLGALCAATRSPREFRREEVDLLASIGNQIGVAVDNARLYEEQRQVADLLRMSEERYRELFENAHDAIWLHDLERNITVANRACVTLTGYEIDELCQQRMEHILCPESYETAKELEEELLENRSTGRIIEVRMLRKDGSEAFVQLATSLLLTGGKPAAFQHIGRDVTEERRMRENLRFYLEQVTNAQEEERKRISRELHDDTIQGLVVLSRELDDLSGRVSSPDKKAALEKLWQQTTGIMEGVRRLSQDLRPAALDRLGLFPALQWLASEVQKHSGISVDITMVGNERRFAPEVELVLFRVVQEALRNVWRHSGATRTGVAIELNEDGIKIKVSDNGKGFDIGSTADLVRGGRLGLAGMRERVQMLNGTLTISSEPGKGTSIEVTAPV